MEQSIGVEASVCIQLCPTVAPVLPSIMSQVGVQMEINRWFRRRRRRQLQISAVVSPEFLGRFDYISIQSADSKP